ncbi:hypothetical protein L9F63_014183, partial [Diploptera punctata]
IPVFYRSGAGSPMRGNPAMVESVPGGGQISSGLYDSGAIPDHDVHDPQRPANSDVHCGGMCKTGEFACLGSCSCIPAAWRCDGDADCVAEEDEVECGEDLDEDPDEDCNAFDGNVRCPRTGKCIREDWFCDGEDDCGDFSDETHCGSDMNCTSDEFQCDNGLCVKSTWRCDGDDDCKDFSDEVNCTRKTSRHFHMETSRHRSIPKRAQIFPTYCVNYLLCQLLIVSTTYCVKGLPSPRDLLIVSKDSPPREIYLLCQLLIVS